MALGHPDRLAVFRLLARRAPHGVRPVEIAEALDLKPNTLSQHLTTLTRAGLTLTWREGRPVFYAVDLARTGALMDFLVNDCCRGRPDLCAPLAAECARLAPTKGANGPLDVLFVCTRNSARSIFAEVILRKLGGRRFRAHSAGIRPASAMSSDAAAILSARGDDTTGLAPRHVDRFRDDSAPLMNVVITVCDRAANEDCPPLPGCPVTAHWGIPDPALAEPRERESAFSSAYDALFTRIARFVALPIDDLEPARLQSELDRVGTRTHPERT